MSVFKTVIFVFIGGFCQSGKSNGFLPYNASLWAGH